MSRVLESATKRLTPLPEVSQDDIDRMTEKWEQLRPIERNAKQALAHQICVAKVAQRFPNGSILNMDVLRWRWIRHLNANVLRMPVPKLALINLSGPTFFIERREEKGQTCSVLPPGLPESHYGDIIKQLNRATAFGSRYKLSFTWEGIIPQASAEIISEAEEFFGDYNTSASYSRDVRPRVYFLAEAPFDGWTVDSERSPRPPKPRYVDPLIVGHYFDKLYVVGSFDPTPLEQYIAAEFTS